MFVQNDFLGTSLLSFSPAFKNSCVSELELYIIPLEILNPLYSITGFTELFHLERKTEEEVFALYIFVLEVHFLSHFVFIVCCSNAAPKSELLIFSRVFK